MSMDLPAPMMSRRTQTDLQKAIRAVIYLAADETPQVWPAELLQRALTRDGDHPVIDHLSYLSAAAVRMLSHETSTHPAEVVHQLQDSVDPPYLPFSRTAWTRARVLTLHRLDGRPLRITGGEISAVDLAGGLALMHVLAIMRVRLVTE
jgi:hypothetical protein